ncbi:hypothetical protein M0804_013629 [Polistes exclamans]|nr:hypothetical protein M0804_013629 [Polistes exclamans]
MVVVVGGGTWGWVRDEGERGRIVRYGCDVGRVGRVGVFLNPINRDGDGGGGSGSGDSAPRVYLTPLTITTTTTIPMEDSVRILPTKQKTLQDLVLGKRY